MKVFLKRADIIARTHARIREGLKASVSSSSFRIHERENIKSIPKVQSTTFRSPLVSRIYSSVFCEGNKKK